MTKSYRCDKYGNVITATHALMDYNPICPICHVGTLIQDSEASIQDSKKAESQPDVTIESTPITPTPLEIKGKSTIKCPHCNKDVEAENLQLGDEIECAYCFRYFFIDEHLLPTKIRPMIASTENTAQTSQITHRPVGTICYVCKRDIGKKLMPGQRIKCPHCGVENISFPSGTRLFTLSNKPSFLDRIIIKARCPECYQELWGYYKYPDNAVLCPKCGTKVFVKYSNLLATILVYAFVFTCIAFFIGIIHISDISDIVQPHKVIYSDEHTSLSRAGWVGSFYTYLEESNDYKLIEFRLLYNPKTHDIFKTTDPPDLGGNYLWCYSDFNENSVEALGPAASGGRMDKIPNTSTEYIEVKAILGDRGAITKY